MNSFQDMNVPSCLSWLMKAYASFTYTMMIVRPIINQLIALVPQQVRNYLSTAFVTFFKLKPESPDLTLKIEEYSGISHNQVYRDSEIYLCTKISPDAKVLKVVKHFTSKNISICFDKGETIHDSFQGVNLRWRYLCVEAEKNYYNARTHTRSFELTFDRMHREKVIHSYLPFILRKSKDIQSEARVLKLYTLDGEESWDSINFLHPSTFDTLAMEPETKKWITEDLDRFVQRKEFYNKVGKAWKRGYLLYGPPGTGKSSLISAMANYLKCDIFDLQLGKINSDVLLRRLLLSTTNRSILVIEDVDCSTELENRNNVKGSKGEGMKVTLGGLLNIIDGLWSSCGDERIIVLTTNHKDKLDPALLRPGRMDVHIHMSYITAGGFRILVSNYLGITEHELFKTIEEMIQNIQVTPAEVAEQLMKSDEADIVLQGLIQFMNVKKQENEAEQNKDKDVEGESELSELEDEKNKEKEAASPKNVDHEAGAKMEAST